MSKFDRLLLIGLALIFIALRFANIGALEIFTDEASNILTSIDNEVRDNIDPMAMGRPLLAYEFKLAGLSQKNALELGRATVAIVSFFSCLLLFFIARSIFNLKIALVCFAVWTFSTYHVAHERLALQDPITTFFLLLMTLLLIKSSKLISDSKNFIPIIFTLFSGALYAASILNKVSGVSGIIWPLGLLFLYIKEKNIKIAFKNYALHTALFAIGLALALLSQERIDDLASRMHTQNYVPLVTILLSDPMKFLGNYFENLLIISDNFYDCLTGYGGVFLTILFLYLLISTPLIGNPTQKTLLGLILSYILIDTAMYNDIILVRYIHHELVVTILFLAYSIYSKVSVSADSFLKKLERAFLIIAAILALFENIYVDISVTKDSHKTILNQKSWDYRQYTDRGWSGSGLDKLDSEISKILVEDPKALFLTTTKFTIVHYGLKLKYYGTDRANKLLHLDLSAESSAPGIAYLKRKYPNNNLYLIISSGVESKAAYDSDSVDYLINNLEIDSEVVKVIMRDGPFEEIFTIFKVKSANYEVSKFQSVIINSFPHDSGLSYILSEESLLACPFDNIRVRSYVDAQEVRIELALAEKYKIIQKNHQSTLKEFEINESDIPIVLIANDWILEDIKGAFHQQANKALLFTCTS